MSEQINPINKSNPVKFNTEKSEDKRVTRSKKDLSDALEALLQEKDLDNITIQEIVDKAMVSKNTFYNNFLDKSALMHYLFSRYEMEIYMKCKPYIDSGEPFDAVMIKCIAIISHFFAENSDMYFKMVKHDKSRSVYWSFNKFTQHVVYQIFDHAPVFVQHPEISREMAAYFYAGAFSNLVYFYFAKGVRVDEETFIKYLIILYKVKVQPENLSI